jgi:O-antigen/teichoic acid export membrane protein
MIGIAAANVSGQVIFILLSMIVTRIISPADMGVFGYFMTFIACGSIAATWGLEGGIVSARTNHAALLLVGCIFYISFITSVVFTLLYILLDQSGVISSHLDNTMLLMVVATITVANFNYAFQFLRIRNLDYKKLSVTGFFNNALRGVGQLFFTSFRISGAHALVMGEALSRIVIVFIIGHRREIISSLRLPFLFSKRILRTVKATGGSALQFLSANVLDTLLFWVPVLLFGHLYGLTTAGFVALVNRLFSGPVQIVSRAMADVYHGHAQKHQDNQEHLKVFTLKLIASIAAAALLIPFVIWALGDYGFTLLFGAQWGPASDIALAMSPLLATQLIAPIATRLGLIKNMIRIRLVYTLTCLMTALIFYLTNGIVFASAESGILVYSVLNLFYCVVYVTCLLKTFQPSYPKDPVYHD